MRQSMAKESTPTSSRVLQPMPSGMSLLRKYAYQYFSKQVMLRVLLQRRFRYYSASNALRVLYKQLILRGRVLLSMRSTGRTREKQFTPFGLRATGWFFNVLILRTLRRMAPAVECTHSLGVSAAAYWVRARLHTVPPSEGQHRPTLSH